MSKGKIFLSIVGSIVLGALGSGLWSLVETPVGFALRWFLNIVTFGAGSVRDSIYANASAGLHETGAIQVLLMVSSLMVAVPISGIGFATISRRFGPFFRVFSVSEDIPASSEDDTEYLQHRYKQLNKQLKILSLIGILCSSFVVVQVMMLNEENLVATTFNQYLRAVRTYISEQEALSLESQYAQMRTKSDYLAILKQLETVGDVHKIRRPILDTW